MDKIKLGARVKDVVTGFEGIAVTRLHYLDGGVDIGVQASSSTKEGAMPKIEYVAEVRLQQVDEGIHVAPVTRAIGFKTAERK